MERLLETSQSEDIDPNQYASSHPKRKVPLGFARSRLKSVNGDQAWMLLDSITQIWSEFYKLITIYKLQGRMRGSADKYTNFLENFLAVNKDLALVYSELQIWRLMEFDNRLQVGWEADEICPAFLKDFYEN